MRFSAFPSSTSSPADDVGGFGGLLSHTVGLGVHQDLVVDAGGLDLLDSPLNDESGLGECLDTCVR